MMKSIFQSGSFWSVAVIGLVVSGLLLLTIGTQNEGAPASRCSGPPGCR